MSDPLQVRPAAPAERGDPDPPKSWPWPFRPPSSDWLERAIKDLRVAGALMRRPPFVRRATDPDYDDERNGDWTR